MNNLNQRDAKRILHGLHHILPFTPHAALSHVAKGLARTYGIPQRVMLKAMARYTRLYINQTN